MTNRKEILERLRLMVISDHTQSRRPLIDALKAALEGGVTAIQLREPEWSARELLQAATELRTITQRHHALLIINDRLDVARAVQADGVHLGWRSLPVSAARELAGDDFLIGFSAHNAEEAREAEQQGADYITIGPVYPTPSKKGLVPVLGIEGVRNALKDVRLPAVALGGIQADNAREVLKTGVRGIAMIRGILNQDDPQAAAVELNAILNDFF